MAAVAALTYAQQLKARGVRSRISTESVSVARSARAGRDQPQPPPRGAHSKAAKLVGAKAESATREKVTVLTAVPAELLARAEKAAYLKDVQAHVLTARCGIYWISWSTWYVGGKCYLPQGRKAARRADQ